MQTRRCAVFAFTIAAATVVSVVLSVIGIRETQALRQAQFDPHVALRLEQRENEPHFVDLVIENEGGGPAFSVEFAVKKDLQVRDAQVLGERELLKRPWSYLGAGQARRTFLLSMFDKDSYASYMEIEASWTNAAGNRGRATYRLDAGEYLGFSTLGEPPLPKLAKELERLRSTIEQITSGRRRLEVVTENREDAEAREMEADERRRKFLEARREVANVPPPRPAAEAKSD